MWLYSKGNWFTYRHLVVFSCNKGCKLSYAIQLLISGTSVTHGIGLPLISLVTLLRSIIEYVSTILLSFIDGSEKTRKA